MKKPDNDDSDPGPVLDPHSEAARRLRDGFRPGERVAEVDARALLHELQVHQIELQMQNEELLRSQALVQEISDKYRDLFDFAPIGYFLLRKPDQIVEANLAAAALLGLERGATAGKRLGQFVAPQSRVRLAEFCSEVLKEDGRRTGEIVLQRDGRCLDAVIEGIRVQDRDPDHGTFRVTVIDVTERKQAEQAVRQSRDELLRDIALRKNVEAEIRSLNQTLEGRVATRTAQLAERAEQLRALAMDLTRAEQRERRRLADVLHDHLQQLLVAARMKTDMLRGCQMDENAGQTAAEIHALLNETIAESRSLAMQLCPPILYDRGLAAGLEWLGQQTAQRFKLAVEVQADPASEPPDETTRVILFQAASELLLNTAKHAGATRARVRMARAETGTSAEPGAMTSPASEGSQLVCIEVSDDGVGFDVSRAANSGEGFGMFSLRQRLELIGGHLEILSSPGQGARVTLWAPVGRVRE